MKKIFLHVAALIISSHIFSQQDSAIHFLDEVVITATKSELKNSLTGKILTIISRDQLQRSGGKDLSQILAEEAGFYIGGANSNAGKDKSLYLRGARVDHTLITLDGVPLYDPSGIGSNFDIRNIPIMQIERIEVLKGSQSTLYGSDAIAGVVNIITRKSAEENFSGVVSYGSNQTGRLNTQVHGKSKNSTYSLGYTFFRTKGIDEAGDNQTGTDRDGMQQHSLNASAQVKPAKNLQVQPYVRFSHIKGDLDQGAFTDELDYTYNQKSLQTGTRSEWKTGKSKLVFLYNYNYINREYIDDSTKSRNGFDIYSRGSYKGSEHFADLYSNTVIGPGVTLTAGIDYRSSNSDQSFYSESNWGTYSSKYAQDSLWQNQLGVYATVNVMTQKGLNAELGSRLNIHSEFGSHSVFNFNPAYLIQKKWKLFVNFSSGYRTPSLYQLFSEFGNKALKPESAFTAEAGFQYFGNENRFTGRMVFFKRNVKDVVFFYFNPNTFQSQFINQDKQKDFGLETELNFPVSPQFALKAFYTFVNGEITTNQNGKDTTYFNLLRRPKHSAGLSFHYRISTHFSLSTGSQYIGKRKDAYYDASSFQTVNTTENGYFLLNLYAEYSMQKKKTKFFVDLRNLTDSRYAEISGFNTTGFTVFSGIRFTL